MIVHQFQIEHPNQYGGPNSIYVAEYRGIFINPSVGMIEFLECFALGPLPWSHWPPSSRVTSRRGRQVPPEPGLLSTFIISLDEYFSNKP